MSRYVSTPGQCYARQTSKGTFFWAGKVCFYVQKIVPVDTLLGWTKLGVSYIRRELLDKTTVQGWSACGVRTECGFTLY
jgi:hypothetical protein